MAQFAGCDFEMPHATDKRGRLSYAFVVVLIAAKDLPVPRPKLSLPPVHRNVTYSSIMIYELVFKLGCRPRLRVFTWGSPRTDDLPCDLSQDRSLSGESMGGVTRQVSHQVGLWQVQFPNRTTFAIDHARFQLHTTRPIPDRSNCRSRRHGYGVRSAE